jgi:hypothetical protein
MGDHQGSGPDLFKPLLQLRMDGAVREKLSPANNFKQAADIRMFADRVQAMAAQLSPAAGQGTAPVIAGELQGMAGTLGQTAGELKAAFGTLFGLAQAQFGAGFGLQMSADKALLDAHFWRNRLVGDLFCASSYYRLAAELLLLAVKTLAKVTPSAAPMENSMLLDHAHALLCDAVRHMGTAGTELGDHEARWHALEKALAVANR